MVTHAEAKIHRVGPRHTIYLAKDLVEDSTFPFQTDDDLTVRIEGDALIIDKDGRSGRRTAKLDEANSLRDRLVTKTLDVLNFSHLTSKAERINQMPSGKKKAPSMSSCRNSLTLGQPVKLQRDCSPRNRQHSNP